jgi:hypothetical protein
MRTFRSRLFESVPISFDMNLNPTIRRVGIIKDCRVFMKDVFALRVYNSVTYCMKLYACFTIQPEVTIGDVCKV